MSPRSMSAPREPICWWRERELGGARERPEGRGYRGGLGNRGTRGHVGALPPATAPMVPGQEYVDYDTRGEVGAFPDGLHPGDGSSSLWKRLRPDPRHNSYHYLVLGCLHRSSLKKHSRYLRGQKKLPLRPPTEPAREDSIFAALRRAIPKTRARESWKNEWISAATWILVDERVSVRRDTAKYYTPIKRLGRAIRESMTTDRRRRAEEAGTEVEALVGAAPLYTRRHGTG